MRPAHLRQEVGQRPADDHRLAAPAEPVGVGEDIALIWMM